MPCGPPGDWIRHPPIHDANDERSGSDGSRIRPRRYRAVGDVAGSGATGVRLLLAGGTLASIARTWNASALPLVEGEPPRPTGRSGAWSADAVRSVLTGDWYAGPLARERLISADEWQTAMPILGEPSRRAQHRS
jgi:hypothetical protein